MQPYEEGLTVRSTEAAVRATVSHLSPDPQLVDVTEMLSGLLAMPVKVVPVQGGTKITLNVPSTQLARVLKQLGADATPLLT